MPAIAIFNPATRLFTVAGDARTGEVTKGTYPNNIVSYSVVEHDFNHTFTYRGGTFGTQRVFDNATWTQEGFIRKITLSNADNALFGPTSNIRPGDHLLFHFSDGIKQRFLHKGTIVATVSGTSWVATDTRLDLIMPFSSSATGTYFYYDQRNGRNNIPLGSIGITSLGVPIFQPSAGTSGFPPAGYSWNASSPNTPVEFGEDACGGRPEQSGLYHYRDARFLSCWKQDSTISRYNDYYGRTQFNGDNLRHPDGHSKIVGISYDGFPIYGPYAYTSPWNNLSGIKILTSSYETLDVETQGRPSYGATISNPPVGALVQDYVYAEGLGDLDLHNGRFCITPEYQEGTYAYFISVDTVSFTPVFPYVVGVKTREGILQPINNGSNPVEIDDGPPPPPPTTRPVLSFTLQPQNATVEAGQSVSFTATGQVIPDDTSGGVVYQWYKSTDGGFAFAPVTGATTHTISFTALSYMTGYRYRCRISGPRDAIGAVLPIPYNASNSPLDSLQVNLTVSGDSSGGSASNRFDNTQTRLDRTSSSFDAT